ncbi:MAG: methyltransferase, partial [Halopseudomonas sp.]
LESFTADSADLILNNPPFHQQQTVGGHIAKQMFGDAKRVLRHDGELWVIGNRHLGYHVQLRKLFGNCELVASNPKFVVLKSIKQ